ncbi:MAG: class I SAM-dependent methyltransferase [Anaerolineae bacterium]|nr:class I SAM-dependent methyltransferase [Anaerolineae bacterium]NUQ04157.1 class I SAM-dependent methyltransferase [Anaerolineae bacterium]
MEKLDQRQTPVSPDLYDEAYFRTACEGFDEFNETEGLHLSRRLASAFALASVKPGMKVLDVGCGRGEILRHTAQLGADAYGIDYAAVAVHLSRQVIEPVNGVAPGRTAVYQADAKHLPFPSGAFDRVLMFDVVEHLHPWELEQSLAEIRRVMKPDGRFIIHTAPNIWYDRYAYPVVRSLRSLMGQGGNYPKNPRNFLVSVNEHVHVNEQSMWSLSRTLRAAGFRGKVWLESPPQSWGENPVIDGLRKFVFRVPPFRWFFEREVFAVVAIDR